MLLTMNEVLAECQDKLIEIEKEKAWAEDKLKHTPFPEIQLKQVLKYHIRFLEDLQLKEMSKVITKLYRNDNKEDNE